MEHKFLTSCLLIFLCGQTIVPKIENRARQEHPLVVVIPTYNNALVCQKNLESVFSQNYSNYRVILIDDCSQDDTYKLVKSSIAEKGYTDRVVLIRNTERKKALANHYRAVHMCHDDEIIVQLDGDDWFKHERVLERINEVYQDSHVWLTYGQHEVFPSGKLGCCKQLLSATIKLNCYRECSWVTSALRTFKVALFKKIKLQDLIYQGKFFETAGDLAFMFPMLEMAGPHSRFIDEILYVYNCETPHNDYKEAFLNQIHTDNVIRAKPKYRLLDELGPKSADSTMSAVIISDNNPIGLHALLASLAEHAMGIKTPYVVYHASNNEMRAQYDNLQKLFSSFSWHLVNKSSFKTKLVDIVARSSDVYITFMRDDLLIKESLDLEQCTQLLAKTHAHGFFLALGHNIARNALLVREQKHPALIHIEEDMYAWQLCMGEHDWKNAYNMFMTIYKKESIENMLRELHYDSLDGLEHAWSHALIDHDAIGLCCEHSKVMRVVKKSREQNHIKADTMQLANHHNDAITVMS
jgi:glycosyltransferase involved in cell wall biosynthesis